MVLVSVQPRRVGLPKGQLALFGRALSTSKSWPRHKLMPMPRLSPTMQTGRLEQWKLRVGEPVSMYQLVCDVMTNELTDASNATVPNVVLEVEACEDGWLAKVLLAEGASAAPDVPM